MEAPNVRLQLSPSTPQTISDCPGFDILTAMISEAAREANYCVSPTDRAQLLAKRDALDELRLRLHGRYDHAWARRVLPLQMPL